MQIQIPEDEDFAERDFLDSEDLRVVADTLIRRKFKDLDDGELIIDYRWKKRGGSSVGAAVFGKCVKLSGLARHLSQGAHFCIWLAADHCRKAAFNDKQIEALMFHELCHIERVEDEDAPVTYKIKGHDSELFFAELQEYGGWRGDLAALLQVTGQLKPSVPIPISNRHSRTQRSG